MNRLICINLAEYLEDKHGTFSTGKGVVTTRSCQIKTVGRILGNMNVKLTWK